MGRIGRRRQEQDPVGADAAMALAEQAHAGGRDGERHGLALDDQIVVAQRLPALKPHPRLPAPALQHARRGLKDRGCITIGGLSLAPGGEDLVRHRGGIAATYVDQVQPGELAHPR